MCGADAAPLLRAVPGLAQMHIIEADASPVEWAALWRALAGRRFDIALNGRGPLFPRTLQVDRFDRTAAREISAAYRGGLSAAFESEAPLARVSI